MVNEPSTSLPCTWNLRKKRKKNPMPLYKASYSGSKNDQSDSSRLYSWDPRPESDRKMDTEGTNRFISTMQLVSRDSEPSMWETLLKIEYDDFELDDIDEQILKTQVADFEENHISYVQSVFSINETVENLLSVVSNGFPSLPCSVSTQIPGTEKQRESETWVQRRSSLITASDSKTVNKLGLKIKMNGDSNAQMTNYLKRKLRENKGITTYVMLYGIMEEPKERQEYENLKNVIVKECGLFLNKRYPWLGASPGGIVYHDGVAMGIIEIKCLKALRDRTVSAFIEEVKEKKISLVNSCLCLCNDSLALRRCHQYYYQIQHQLLLTEFEYCDFVIHSR